MKCSVCGEEKKTYLVLADEFVICGCCALEKLEKAIHLAHDFGGLGILQNLIPVLGVLKGGKREEKA